MNNLRCIEKYEYSNIFRYIVNSYLMNEWYFYLLEMHTGLHQSAYIW